MATDKELQAYTKWLFSLPIEEIEDGLMREEIIAAKKNKTGLQKSISEISKRHATTISGIITFNEEMGVFI